MKTLTLSTKAKFTLSEKDNEKPPDYGDAFRGVLHLADQCSK
ncbi:hypothetical protein [Bradyrhizobium genosp. P]